MQLEQQIQAVAGLLDEAERVLFITGAGISADSGLPTYRGIGGLYADQETVHGVPIEEALSNDVFQTNPEITWHYLWQLGQAAQGAEPNFAHWAIARVVAQKPGSWVMTQNVDGLHGAAHTANLVELHGNAQALYCTQCSWQTTAAAFLDNYGEQPELPPRCDRCGGIIRPDVTLFGENLPEPAMAFLQNYDDYQFDLVISVGTTAAFPYIAAPVALAYQNEVPSVEINPSMTVISDTVTYAIRLGAAAAFTRICTYSSICDTT